MGLFGMAFLFGAGYMTRVYVDKGTLTSCPYFTTQQQRAAVTLNAQECLKKHAVVFSDWTKGSKKD